MQRKNTRGLCAEHLLPRVNKCTTKSQLVWDRRVVDVRLVLAHESDVYNDPKGSSGYEQGSDEKDVELYKPPSREINLS